MTLTSDLLKVGRLDDIWTKHCGFINLSLDDYMEIQARLLSEQIELLYASKLGSQLMKGVKPANIEEFQANVPLTTYEDYAPYLDEKNEDVLPGKVYMWSRTSGRTSEIGHNKWAPYTKTMYDLLGDTVIGAMILSSCSFKGDVTLQVRDKLLLSVAPPPYISGLFSFSLRDQLDVSFLPSLEDGAKMSYGERVAAGFSLAMKEGLDYFFGIASVLVRIGEQFEQSSSGTKPSLQMLNPLVLWRLLRAVFKTKIQNRSLLPKDIWQLKGVMTGGTDTAIYKDKIEYYWGRKPLEGYANTESGLIAFQAWNYKGMTFFPDRDLLEFIPYEEHLKLEEDPTYHPQTKLMHELEEGIYELVITNFHGGAFVRYRVGDLFTVLSIGDEEIDSVLPQFWFYSRYTDVIDLSSMVRLTETDIWEAIEAADISYQDWIVRKEFDDEKPVLHVYIEPKPGENISIENTQELISNHLIKQHQEYQDFIDILGRDPLKLSLLSSGAFDAYMKAQVEAGADMAHIKPPHVEPADGIMERLEQS